MNELQRVEMLKGVVAKHSDAIAQELGLDVAPIFIDIKSSTEIIKVGDKGVRMGYCETKFKHLTDFAQTIVGVEGITVTVYVNGICKAWNAANAHDIENIMIHTLAHELRHAQQSINAIGKSMLAKNMIKIPYAYDPDEVDANEYGDKYLASINRPTPKQIHDKIQRKFFVLGTAIQAAAVLGFAYAVKKRRNRK